MSDVASSYKWSREKRPARKSGDSAVAKKATTLRKADGWTPGLSRAGAIKFAQSKSGIYAHLRGVLGRRRVTTINNEY